MKNVILLASTLLLGTVGCMRSYNDNGAETKAAGVPTLGVLLTCESYGAKLVITRIAAGLGTNTKAELSGKGAELVRDEQGKDVKAIGGGYDAGKTWDTKKRLPTTFTHNFDKAGEAPLVTIEYLNERTANDSFIGFYKGQYDPSIAKEAGGYKVVFPFFEITGSHNTVGYEYANWFFADKDCKGR
jgi:hypothetical protein